MNPHFLHDIQSCLIVRQETLLYSVAVITFSLPLGRFQTFVTVVLKGPTMCNSKRCKFAKYGLQKQMSWHNCMPIASLRDMTRKVVATTKPVIYFLCTIQ